jgi:hypothetical protein
MTPVSDYRYFDMGDGLALAVINPDRKALTVVYSGEMIPMYGHGVRLLPVPRQFAARRRAPNVIWKKTADPDVKNAVDVEMVSLGGLFDVNFSPTMLFAASAGAALLIIGSIILVTRGRKR